MCPLGDGRVGGVGTNGIYFNGTQLDTDSPFFARVEFGLSLKYIYVPGLISHL